ncbi:MAG: hypothetical protein CMJ96_06575 [Planctomycetes bacterium]|jgi:HEAT repeat protein|nr:hypothetical protein [Planctomycetota bacterium]MDP7246141.1 hypothetical protein [Planctomycetota bacterium]MDP7560050.1 hypothetical protein [Planctomycetota bacterium]|tara:strand:- start:32527 stop:34065 length:1539 start_codon:yes stop_codon:yes gene_type:complete
MALSPILLLIPLLAPQQDETVRDFKKYFKRSKDTMEKVEYVHALKGIDDPSIAKLLLPLLVHKEPPVALAAHEVLVSLSKPELRASLMESVEKGKPKNVFHLLLRVAGDGGWTEYAPLIRPHLESRSEEVRLWSAYAAGRFQDTEAVPFLAVLAGEDKSATVRVSALNALAGMGEGFEEVAGPPAVACLAHPSLPVQAAACKALQKIRVKEAIAPLIEMMDSASGRVLELVYPTLIEITDLQYSDEPSLWKKWWARSEENYVLPASDEIARRRAARKTTNELYRPSKKTGSFVGVDTPSEHVVFVIDISGSMEEFVVDRDNFREKGFTRFEKMEIVRKEVMKAIESLGSNVYFNILAFASEVEPWRKKRVPANSLNKRSALDFLRKLEPIGGAAASEMAQAGLTGAAALGKGRTNTYGALCQALGVDPKMETALITPGAVEKSKGVDTVFFLSDGIPSVGEIVEPDDILAAILEFNRFRRVVIHTVSIGEFKKDFMIDLARKTDGVYVDLGR